MRVPKIEVRPQGLSTLMSEIENGDIRIPRFQRERVWRRSDILKLMDSMYKEYPIGTIFLWNAPSDYNHLLRNSEELGQPSIDPNRSYKIILDGQQRLTSLYAVIKGIELDGEDYNKIVVDLANGDLSRPSFAYRNPDIKRWMSVSKLLAYLTPFRDEITDGDRRARFDEIRFTLYNYPFSVVTVSAMEINDAIEIFERINQRGRKLTRYDLICASVMTDEFDLRDRSDEDIISTLKAGFGEIEETSIPQAVALNSKGRTEHSTQLGLTTTDVLQVWDETVNGFRLAVEFVKKNLGVARKDFLPYDAMLPVLGHYFYQTDSHAIQAYEHRKQLEYWFWRTTFSQRYSGASQTRMTEDATWIRQLIEQDVPYTQIKVADENDLVGASMRSTTSAIRNGILCLLNMRRPLHFRNRSEISIGGDHFSTFSRAEKHHIFPAEFLRKRGFALGKVHSIPNFCFVPSQLNRWISDKAPSEYMTEIREQYADMKDFESVMRSHLIPVDNDSGIWTDDFELFLRQRARLLVQEIKLKCGITSSVEPEYRDPIVNRIEVALRDRIHETLIANGPTYWKFCIPSDVSNRVEENISKHLRKVPGADRRQFHDPRMKLDFCDVSDYSKIIVNNRNWQLFGAVFKSKQECERVLGDFREFRAALKHNRQIDDMQDHRAQAAILWLRNALELDLREFGL